MDQKSFYERYWYGFCIFFTILAGLGVWISDQTLNLNKPWFQWLGLAAGILNLSFLFIASKVTVYKHKFGTHPSSFIAQTHVFGEKNTKAVIFFMGFPIFLSILSFLFGKMIRTYYNNLLSSDLFAFTFYVVILAIVWMAAVPINFSRFGHLGGVLGMFICYLAGHIIILIFLRNLKFNGFEYPPGTQIFAWFEVIISAIYMSAYFYDLVKQPPFYFKPGFWQKIWIIAFNISQVFYLFFFLRNEDMLSLLG